MNNSGKREAKESIDLPCETSGPPPHKTFPYKGYTTSMATGSSSGAVVEDQILRDLTTLVSRLGLGEGVAPNSFVAAPTLLANANTTLEDVKPLKKFSLRRTKRIRQHPYCMWDDQEMLEDQVIVSI